MADFPGISENILALPAKGKTRNYKVQLKEEATTVSKKITIIIIIIIRGGGRKEEEEKGGGTTLHME